MGQVTLADNNGHLSACFRVMRRKRRRFLDLSMRVTVYNPLTASSYWRMTAVLIELRHDAVIGLPGTQKRVAVDAPPYQSHKFNGAWGLSWGFRRGAYESNRSGGVSLLFSSRWFRQGHLRPGNSWSILTAGGATTYSAACCGTKTSVTGTWHSTTSDRLLR